MEKQENRNVEYYESKGVFNGEVEDYKNYVNEIKSKTRKGGTPTKEEIGKIMFNIDKGTHNDIVNIDAIITNLANRDLSEYNYGSLLMNCKWRIC